MCELVCEGLIQTVCYGMFVYHKQRIAVLSVLRALLSLLSLLSHWHVFSLAGFVIGWGFLAALQHRRRPRLGPAAT